MKYAKVKSFWIFALLPVSMFFSIVDSPPFGSFRNFFRFEHSREQTLDFSNHDPDKIYFRNYNRLWIAALFGLKVIVHFDS